MPASRRKGGTGRPLLLTRTRTFAQTVPSVANNNQELSSRISEVSSNHATARGLGKRKSCSGAAPANAHQTLHSISFALATGMHLAAQRQTTRSHQLHAHTTT